MITRIIIIIIIIVIVISIIAGHSKTVPMIIPLLALLPVFTSSIWRNGPSPRET